MVVQPPAPTSGTESGPSTPNNSAVRRVPPVMIEQIVVDQAFVQVVQTFDTMLQAGTVLDYCDHQISSTSNSQDEQIVWRFLRASFESDSRSHFIELLGFRREEILQRAQTLKHEDTHPLPTEAMNGLHIGENQIQKKSTTGKDDLSQRRFTH